MSPTAKQSNAPRHLSAPEAAVLDAQLPAGLTEEMRDVALCLFEAMALTDARVGQPKPDAAWLVQGFEDGMIDIPADPNIAQDLRAIEEVDGIAMVAKARRADVKDPDLFRHGDGAVMLCLGWFATLNLSAVIDYIPVPGHSRGFDNKINSHADLDFPMLEPGGW